MGGRAVGGAASAIVGATSSIAFAAEPGERNDSVGNERCARREGGGSACGLELERIFDAVKNLLARNNIWCLVSKILHMEKNEA